MIARAKPGFDPEIIRCSVFALQVCVPATWTDEEIEEFAEQEHPAGAFDGWHIQRDGPYPERVSCNDREGFIHVVVEV